MKSLHEYESYLDGLDKKMYAKPGAIHIDFSHPFDVSLADIKDIEDLIQSVRRVSVKLLEENTNIDYLSKRFIKLAAKSLNIQVNPSELYQKHSIAVVSDAILSTNENDVLRFENSKGEFAGHHFVELRKRPKGKVRVVRNMIGYPRETQYIDTSQINIMYLPSHIILSLDPNINWTYSVKGRRLDTNWLFSTRLALNHHMKTFELNKTREILANFLQKNINHA